VSVIDVKAPSDNRKVFSLNDAQKPRHVLIVVTISSWNDEDTRSATSPSVAGATLPDRTVGICVMTSVREPLNRVRCLSLREPVSPLPMPALGLWPSAFPSRNPPCRRRCRRCSFLDGERNRSDKTAVSRCPQLCTQPAQQHQVIVLLLRYYPSSLIGALGLLLHCCKPAAHFYPT
jgi:hypothetical protein